MIYYERFSHDKPKLYINLQNTAKNDNFSSVLAHKHDQITFLLIEVETSRLHHFKTQEKPVQKSY